MKTHLPHGLRVALMAAIASVSLTSYAAATDVVVDGNYYGYQQTSGNLNLTFKPSGSFNRENVDRLYVLTASHTGDVNATVQQSLLGSQSKGYYLVGMGSRITLDGSLSLRTVATGASATNRGNVLGLDYSDTVTGNVYMGLADNNTYSGWVYGVMNSTVQGTSKLEIASGTFNGNVAVGYVNSWSNTNTVLNKGTELKITGGTFTNTVAAGSVIATNSPAAATISDGARLNIEGGVFSSTVYGGSTGSKSTINGSAIKNAINVSISGGTFNSGSSVYALGSGGTVNGGVNLTIKNNAKFLGNNVISAGTDGSVDYSGVTSSTVFLENLMSTSSLATDGTIKVMGGQQQSKLVMWGGSTTIKAQLSQFSTMSLWYGANITLTQDTNEALGGVSSVELTLYSTTLNLQNNAGQTWDLSRVALTEVGTLKKTGAGKLTIGDTSAFTGTLSVQDGELSLSGATNANYLTVANGATLSVKEGNLFTGTGAGKTISINGATLAANEGDWTLNKAATIDGVTISGTGAVALGSEEDKTAVVSLSGNIDATNGNLILKNTAIAAGKTATLSGNITFEGLDNKGNLILKDIAIAADTTATLSGNLTFEGLVDNKGTLSLVDGSTINIDEKTLAHDAHFVERDKQTDNGFLADTSVRLATGGDYNVGSVNVTLDGEKVEGMALTTKTEGGTNELQVSGFAEKEAKTYFVNKGEVSHSHIQVVAEDMGRTVEKISVEGTLTSDKTETISEALIGSGKLAKSGEGTLTVTDAKDFSGDVEVSGGTLQVEDADLMAKHKERKITVSNRAVANLTKLSTGATVKALDLDGTLGVYTGETADEGNVGSLTVTGALTVRGEGSKLEANLTLDSGSIFDVSAGYSLELGCTLTMNDNLTIVLSDTQKDALAAGSAVELMTGVDALTGTLPKNFTIKDYDGPEAQFVYSGTTLSLSQTPEPTTTTLSLLALAALAARRKRK